MADALAPGFLIAVPQLLDPNFRQAVVLLLQQDDEGAMGVIVNRESPLLLKDLCEDHDIAYSGNPVKRVRRGGPVQPEQGLVLYGDGYKDPEGQEITAGLNVSASMQTLSRLCKTESGGRFQCYAGYAGWGPNQLEQEIREGAWITATVDPILIFDAPTDEIWRKGLKSVGIDPAALVPGGDQQA